MMHFEEYNVVLRKITISYREFSNITTVIYTPKLQYEGVPLQPMVRSIVARILYLGCAQMFPSG